MKILLLGSNGQLGKELEHRLSTVGSVEAFPRPALDITHHKAVRDAVCSIHPNIIVNAAAYTAVDKAENDAGHAYAVNAGAVANLAQIAKTESAWLIHYSTDYVFDGSKPTPYVETDIPNPINVYGASKLAGEYAVSSTSCQHLIFRTTWAVSNHSKSFIRRVINKAMNEHTFDVVKDQIGVTTSTRLIAEVTLDACKSIGQVATWPSGIYHLVPTGMSNRYEIVQILLMFCENHHISLKARAADIRAITTHEYLTPAQRPLNSQLATNKLQEKLSFDLPHWKDDFLAVASDIVKELGTI